MSLMHPRVMNNYAKNGYYPTDDATMRRILTHFAPSDADLTILDPCCGDGNAVHNFLEVFENANLVGIEKNLKNFEQHIINKIYHADLHDISTPRACVDLLFLNPPYGNEFKNNEVYSNETTKRLEHTFITLTYSMLAKGGVLVLIIPRASYDDKRRDWLIANFTDIRLFEAGVDTYNQVVFIGRKSEAPRAVNNKLRELFEEKITKGIGDDMILHRLECSKVSKTPLVVKFKRITEELLTEETKKYKGLWGCFDMLFTQADKQTIKPLHRLSDWHKLTLLTSGIVSGIFEDNAATRKLLMKGQTVKYQTTEVNHTFNDKGDMTATTTELKDRWSAEIFAIDVKRDSPTFGEVFTVK